MAIEYANFTNIFGNNISDNLGYGLSLNENCSNTLIDNNNLERNNIGIQIGAVGGPFVDPGTWGIVNNKIYWNNIVGSNGLVNISEPSSVFYWDNGKVGNYWSYYNGHGSYVIDKNNVDHHPLTKRVDISSNAPVPELSWWIIVPLLLSVFSVAVIVRHRKTVNLSL